MKILIAHDGSPAHGFQRMGLAKAFKAAGHDVGIWHINEKPAYDVFDEVEPDIFIGQTYNLSSSLIECIKERPALHVVLRASDWGTISDSIDRSYYQILIASQEEVDKIMRLYEETGQPECLNTYYHPDYLDTTMNYWSIPVFADMLAADVFDYSHGKVLPELQTDLCFVGGYWGYKAINIDRFLLPLRHKHKMKIFTHSSWPVPQYCGNLPQDMHRHAFKSAQICPNIHEPHSTDFGYDMNERTFKLLCSQSFVISDYVEGLNRLFPDEIVLAKTPEEFAAHIEHFLRYPYEKVPYIMRGHKKVLEYHTYFDRAKDYFVNLNLLDEAEQMMVSKKKVLEEMKLW